MTSIVDAFVELHNLGAHFLEVPEDSKKSVGKWKDHPLTLNKVKALASKPLCLAVVPGSLGLVIIDVDVHTGEKLAPRIKAVEAVLGPPICQIPTPGRGKRKLPGAHMCYRKQDKTVGSPVWKYGEVRADKGYVVAYNPGKVLKAARRVLEVEAVDVSKLPRDNEASPKEGNRNNVLYGEARTLARKGELNDETRKELTDKYLGLGLEPNEIRDTLDSAAECAGEVPIYPRLNDEALEDALKLLGVECRYNLRSSRAELRQKGKDWEPTNGRTVAKLVATIAKRFSYSVNRGESPLKYGRDNWNLNFSALLKDREVDPFLLWLEAIPQWDRTERIDKYLIEFFTAGPVREVFCQIGRGGGKTRAASAALVATAIKDYPTLAKGERAKAFLLAQNKSTARQAFGYVSGILNNSKQLKRMIVGQTKSTIQLSNNVDIEIVTSNFRHVREFGVVAAVADEASFWWLDSDSANSDKEVLNAIRPGLARVPGSVMFVISSPHATRGALYEANKKYFGNEQSKSVLFWKASTTLMNPTFSKAELDRAFEKDGISAKVEYDAEFKKDSESFISAEAIDAVTETDRIMLPPRNTTLYHAFIDTTGGAGRDSVAMAIGHVEENNKDVEIPPQFVIDTLVERVPPFKPSETLTEFSKILRMYRVSRLTGDRYAGDFPAEAFSKSGIRFEATEHSKSQIYKSVLPLITSGRVALLDKPRLRNQLLNLERKSIGGRDSIDHPRNAHDDVANAACGLLVYLSEKGIKNHGTAMRSGHLINLSWPSGDATFCIVKTRDGKCIPGKRRKPAKSKQDTYHLSDKLWAEIGARDPFR